MGVTGARSHFIRHGYPSNELDPETIYSVSVDEATLLYPVCDTLVSAAISKSKCLAQVDSELGMDDIATDLGDCMESLTIADILKKLNLSPFDLHPISVSSTLNCLRLDYVYGHERKVLLSTIFTYDETQQSLAVSQISEVGTFDICISLHDVAKSVVKKIAKILNVAACPVNIMNIVVCKDGARPTGKLATAKRSDKIYSSSCDLKSLVIRVFLSTPFSANNPDWKKAHTLMETALDAQVESELRLTFPDAYVSTNSCLKLGEGEDKACKEYIAGVRNLVLSTDTDAILIAGIVKARHPERNIEVLNSYSRHGVLEINIFKIYTMTPKQLSPNEIFAILYTWGHDFIPTHIYDGNKKVKSWEIMDPDDLNFPRLMKFLLAEKRNQKKDLTVAIGKNTRLHTLLTYGPDSKRHFQLAITLRLVRIFELVNIWCGNIENYFKTLPELIDIYAPKFQCVAQCKSLLIDQFTTTEDNVKYEKVYDIFLSSPQVKRALKEESFMDDCHDNILMINACIELMSPKVDVNGCDK